MFSSLRLSATIKLVVLVAAAGSLLAVQAQDAAPSSTDSQTSSTSTDVRSEPKTQSLPELPVTFPSPIADEPFALPTPYGAKETTIVPSMQAHLVKYLRDYRLPIAAIVVMDVRSGDILAMAQGRLPEEWGATSHAALHGSFPAASLFKTVVTAAALEVADIGSKDPLGLWGGCQNVRASGVWMKENVAGLKYKMNLRRAYGKSCNGFYAKIAVNHLGLGAITTFAKKFGWDRDVPVDFALPTTPFHPPSARNTSTHTVGRYAAGFGYVGMNAVHAAYTMAIIGNDGRDRPMRLFKDSPSQPLGDELFAPQTATQLRNIMESSIRGGTASFAFRRGKTRRFRNQVGGKTGTLTGHSPKGLTTWFTGLYPLEQPEIAMAAVVVLEDLWFIKGPHLAAEAVWAYDKHKKMQAKAAAETAQQLKISKEIKQ